MACVVASVAADCIVLWRLRHAWYVPYAMPFEMPNVPFNRTFRIPNRLILIPPTPGLFFNFAAAWIVFALDIQLASASAPSSTKHSIHIWKYIILGNTVAVNVYMTSLIAFQVWRNAQATQITFGRVDHPRDRLVGALVESGILYTMVYVTHLICLLAYNVRCFAASCIG